MLNHSSVALLVACVLAATSADAGSQALVSNRDRVTLSPMAQAEASEALQAVSHDAFWSMALEAPLGATEATPAAARPLRFRAYHVQLAKLRERLSQAPPETRDIRAGVEITLPLPDGRLERFRVVESPILGPEMLRQHPDIHTYLAVGADNASLSARLDVTALGVRALVFTPEGVALIDPLQRGRTDEVISDWASDQAGGPFECAVTEARMLHAAPSGVFAIGDQLKTFRFIFMGVGEYTQALGGVSLAIAEMVTTVNRVNAFFQRDFAVRLEAVALMPFPDPPTDPYPDAGLAAMDRNSTVVDSIFGWTSYDLSQVLGYQATDSYAGVSVVPGVCDSGYKANCAVVGHDNTAANWRFLKVVCHELGHMLGSMHMQDANCARWPDTAYEPGSGSTIMSYAGSHSCQAYWVQPLADPYYHAKSIEAIVDIWTARTDCGTLTATGNTPPTVEAGPDYTIPRGTPFVLVGSGFDPDPYDTLTYGWEQVDQAPTSGDPVNGPLFRSRLPSTSPVRPLPALATVLSGTADPFEKLPAVDRTLHFRLTVRDNHVGTGGHAWDEKTITVSGVPFVVTFPNGGDSFSSGQVFTVAWTAGGGSTAPTVNILLSTDGGANWTMLEPNTPNDGSESVRYYTATTSITCRIRVEAVGNIFYDVSNADFTINGGTTGVPSGPALPTELALRPAAPNPSSARADLGIELPRETLLDLAVYTIQGQRVRTLASGRWAAGRHRITWDGDDDSGRGLSAGVYFARLTTAQGSRTARLVRLR